MANILWLANYDRESFVVDNFPFVFFTVDAALEELVQSGVCLQHKVAVDGVSELLADTRSTSLMMKAMKCICAIYIAVKSPKC